MKEAGVKAPGTMAAVSGVSQEALMEMCKKASQDGKIVVLSNINSKDQIVISGHKENVEKACDLLVGEGGTATFLKVSAAFHSPLMNPAASDFSEELVKYNYNQMKRTVISNVTALPYESEKEIVNKLKLQIISPVMWKQSMEYLRDKGVEVAVEMQPKTVLKNLMRKNAPEIKTYSFDRNADVQSLKEFISVMNKEKNNKTSNKTNVVDRCLAIAVCTRNYNWNDEEYTAGVINPYRQIKSMREKIESENREPTYDEMISALNMLKSVFKTKKVPEIEQKERFEQIFNETGTAELFIDFSIL
ncbi:ACP S-malonyltransferase [Ruminiclostridium josui]